jgi:hypothetical protein
MICAAWNAAQIVLRPLGAKDLRSEERENKNITTSEDKERER